MTNAEDQPLYRRLFWRANRSSSGSRLMNFSSGVAQAYAITPRIIGTKKNPKRPGTWDSCWLVWTRRQGRRGDRGCRPVHSDRRTHDERFGFNHELHRKRRRFPRTRCGRMAAAKLMQASELSQFVIEPNRSSLVLQSDWTGPAPPFPRSPCRLVQKRQQEPRA
jgi:hypothetical protein